jgi:mRNA (guanine-N7-)-methyltransferase
MEEVVQHYNSRLDMGIESRQKSEIFALRKMNNWIKSVLIKRYVTKNNKVLDLGCGKGGDLLKFAHAQIKEYVGVDIASKSIDDAKKRNLGYFEARFIVADCFSVTLGLSGFDFVNSQFCIHYAFYSELSVRKLLENVSKALNNGGVWVATFPDADRLLRRGLEFGNSIYKVRFENDDHPMFGDRYWFTLQGVIDCPEYVVNLYTLEKLAMEYDLHLENKINLEDFYSVNIRDNDAMKLYKRMQVKKLSLEELEAVGLYLGCVFRKNESKSV